MLSKYSLATLRKDSAIVNEKIFPVCLRGLFGNKSVADSLVRISIRFQLCYMATNRPYLTDSFTTNEDIIHLDTTF